MPTSSQLAQRMHYSSLVPHQPLIISQHKQKAKKTLAEEAEGKQECAKVVSDSPNSTCGVLLLCSLCGHRGLLLRRLISCRMIDSMGNCF